MVHRPENLAKLQECQNSGRQIYNMIASYALEPTLEEVSTDFNGGRTNNLSFAQEEPS